MKPTNFQISDHGNEISTSESDSKYSHDAILNTSKIKKGQTRWNQCFQNFNKINKQAFDGPVLDFGCGVGYFVYEGLRRGINIWGVDTAIGKIKRYQYLIKHSQGPEEWYRKCLLADGMTLPFPSNTFSAVTSWWVLEHIATPNEIIHELVRITQPGGVIVIRAQDARTDWEGHCKIPWIPYLSGKLARVWIEEFGKSITKYENVYNITQPQVIAILEERGFRIISKAPTPPPVMVGNSSLENCTVEEVRQLARLKKVEYDAGRWSPNPDGLYLYAQKTA